MSKYVIGYPDVQALRDMIEQALGVKVLECSLEPEGVEIIFERELTSDEEAKLAGLVNDFVIKIGSRIVKATPLDALIQKILDEIEFEIELSPIRGKGRARPVRKKEKEEG